MFSKPTKTPSKSPVQATPVAAAPAPVAPEGPKARPRVASLISDGITIEGGVTGDVRVGRLTVGETGHIEGSVYAEATEVRGRVIGSVTAKQVRLYGTSYVDGDITHEQLAMETGAFFQGRSLKFQRPAAPQHAPAPQPVSHAPSAPAGDPFAAPPKPHG
jgi:cytoskeletal protein CcmA (bactofilin family)